MNLWRGRAESRGACPVALRRVVLRWVARPLRGLFGVPARMVVALLRIYRLTVSPTYGQVCRFYPSCSAYALQAVERYGVLRGGWLTLRRLSRCHPWNPGGVDPVPETVGRAAEGEQSAESTSQGEASDHVLADDANPVPGRRRAA